jgi:hypothetical protein
LFHFSTQGTGNTMFMQTISVLQRPALDERKHPSRSRKTMTTIAKALCYSKQRDRGEERNYQAPSLTNQHQQVSAGTRPREQGIKENAAKNHESLHVKAESMSAFHPRTEAGSKSAQGDVGARSHR